MTSFVQVGVKRWLQREVPDLCSPRQSANLICPGVRVFYSSSIFWSVQALYALESTCSCGFLLQGLDWTSSSIRPWQDVSPDSLLAPRRSGGPVPHVLVNEALPKVSSSTRERAGCVDGSHSHAAGNGDQLFFLVPGRVHLPCVPPLNNHLPSVLTNFVSCLCRVLPSAPSIPLVVQVQLRPLRRSRRRDSPQRNFHFPHTLSAKERDDWYVSVLASD